MQQTESNESLANHQIGFIRSHVSQLKHLSPPSEKWTKRELPKNITKLFKAIQTRNLIEKVGEEEIEGVSYNLWRTKPNAYSYIQSLVEEKPASNPCCGGTGWKNLRDTDYYECKECGETLAKSNDSNKRFETTTS